MAETTRPALTQAQRESILAEQRRHSPPPPQAAGNPFATLCLNCYGRHAPPKDEICQHEPPKRSGT